MEEITIADVLRDAIAAADDHLKNAREKLFEAQNVLEMLKSTDGRFLVATMTKEATTMVIAEDENQEQQFFQETQASGLAGVWTILTLLVTLIAIVGFLRKKKFNVPRSGFISEYQQRMEVCIRSAYTKLCEICCMYRNVLGKLLNLTKPLEINNEYVKNEIKESLEHFRSVKEQLKLMKSQKVVTKDVENIKSAIKTVRSIEEHLKVMKSQEKNEDEVKEIEAAIQPAIKAVESMEEIINKGVWLLPQF